LRYIDSLVSKKYHEILQTNKDVEIMCFSDHGHTDIKLNLDIKDFFKKNNCKIDNFSYVIDSTFARFWPRNEVEKEELKRVLNELSDKGSLLSDLDYESYNVKMPDYRYGEVIFVLNPSYKFSNPYSPFLKYRNYISQLSTHGYRPEIPDMDGIFVSSLPIKKNVKRIKLQDVFVSILGRLELPIPDYVDGDLIWEK